MISIKNDIAKHLTNMRAEFYWSSVPDKTKKMIKTYCRTGVIGGNGVAAKISKLLRANARMQILVRRGPIIIGRNIKDEAVWEAVHAAVIMNRISGTSDIPYYCEYEEEYSSVGYNRMSSYNDTINVKERKPRGFYIRYSDVSKHLKLNRLSDSLEVNITDWR